MTLVVKLICEWCGDPFTPTNKRGRKPKFCCPSHKQRAYELRKREQALAR